MKVAIMNAGLMEDIMIHEVFDYNKTFNKAASAGKDFKSLVNNIGCEGNRYYSSRHSLSNI